MGKSPFQRHCLSDPDILVGTSGRPLIVPDDESLRHIDNLRARAHAGLHCQCIEERLDGGTDLALALTDIVILEIAVVRAADIGLDVSGYRLYGYETCPED